MEYRKFGRTGWDVSILGHGMWGMGAWSGSDDETSLGTLRHSIELGVNFFDTAWIYGSGRSEKLLGKIVKEYPDKKIFVTTRVPPKNMKWPMEPFYSLDATFPEDHIFEYVQKSINNLGRIDLLLLHGWDDAWALNGRIANVVGELKKKGFIKAFGISIDRWEPENGIQAIEAGFIDAVEVIYNIFDQAPVDRLFPVCRKYDVGVIARVPFDEGSLTGKLTMESHWSDGDWRNLYFGPENLAPTLERVGKLEKALPKNISLPEAALRFIQSNADVHTIIPGMRHEAYIEANRRFIEKGALDKKLLDMLRTHRWDRVPTPWAG